MAELVALSPVHIGSGEKLTAYDFVFRDGRLSVINVGALLSESSDRAEDFYRQASQREFSLSKFLSEDEVSAYGRYSVRCPKEPKRDVSEAIKTSTGEVYIPGSSIKGALRTALACYFLSKADDDTWRKIEHGDGENSDIRGIRNIGGRGSEKRVGKEVEKVIFGCGYRKSERDNFTIYGDAKFDLLKFITVRDTSCLPPEDCLNVSMIKVYSINGSRINAKPFEIFVESVMPGRSFEFEIGVDTSFISRADEMETKLRWIGLTEKLEAYFGVTSGDDERTIRSKVLETIEKACKFFSERVIEKELSILPENICVHTLCGQVVSNDFRNKGKKYCRSCNEGSLSDSETMNLSEEVRDFYRTLEGKTLLRLGFSTSWYSHTVGVMLSEELVEYVRRRFDLDRDRRRSAFPKTRRFAFDADGRVYPLGWVEIKGV